LSPRDFPLIRPLPSAGRTPIFRNIRKNRKFAPNSHDNYIRRRLLKIEGSFMSKKTLSLARLCWLVPASAPPAASVRRAATRWGPWLFRYRSVPTSRNSRKTGTGRTNATTTSRSWGRSHPALRRPAWTNPVMTRSCGPWNGLDRPKAACLSCTRFSGTTCGLSRRRSRIMWIRRGWSR